MNTAQQKSLALWSERRPYLSLLVCLMPVITIALLGSYSLAFWMYDVYAGVPVRG